MHSDNFISIIDEELIEESDIKPINPLSALDERFQAEKEALLARLKGKQCISKSFVVYGKTGMKITHGQGNVYFYLIYIFS